MKNWSVFVAEPIADAGILLLKNAGLHVVYPPERTGDQLQSIPDNCEAVIVRTAVVSRQLIDANPQLKIIARHGTGIDNIDIEAAKDHNIIVTKLPNANIQSVAEHIVALMMALSRNIIVADAAFRNGRFPIRDQLHSIELESKTIGLIGYGKIGKRVAEICINAFKMKVIAYDPYVQKIKQPSITFTESVDELLMHSDFVSLHLPYTEKLHHFINEQSLQKMKPSAFLINCARGGLVDEQALFKALLSKQIKGAALDVFENEKTVKSHPLWKLKEVIVTPHLAALTTDALERMSAVVAEQIISASKGITPDFIVTS